MSSNLFNQIHYESPRDHIISEFIREYDISKANISVLREAGVLTEEQYQYYYSCDKLTRVIDIGVMMKNDKSISSTIKNGIMNAKRRFFEENSIENDDILEIRNDAVFILNKRPVNTTFGMVNFSLKNEYTSFYKIPKLKFFYFQDQRLGVERISVTGINDDILVNKVFSQHKEYFLDFLLAIFDTAQNCSINDVIDMITSFYNKYLNRELDPGYYREFNSDSMFKFVDMGITKIDSYKVEQISPSQLKYIDIENNRFILQELFKIFSKIKTFGG